jgi:hypothetical protein
MQSIDQALALLKWPLDKPPRVIDICMAGGGFLAAVRQRYRDVVIYDLTLPKQLGRHEMYPFIPYSSNTTSTMGRTWDTDDWMGSEMAPFPGAPVHLEIPDLTMLKD